MSIAMMMIQMELVEYIVIVIVSFFYTERQWVGHVAQKHCNLNKFWFPSPFQLHDQINSMVLLESIFHGLWSVSIVFAACELVQRMSNGISETGDLIWQTTWYLVPIDLQRLLPTVLNNAQQPAVVRYIGSVVCSRDQFKKVNIDLYQSRWNHVIMSLSFQVINTGYKYFMVLHKMY